jgi:OOP family OmpA-OmpF porin
MTAELDQLVRHAVSSVQPGQRSPAITVIDVDGKPAVLRSDGFSSQTPEPGFERDRDAFVVGLGEAIDKVRAKSGQVDDLAALDRAARAVKDQGGGVVVLLDSGLQTVAPLDFRQPGLLDADAKTVVGFLKGSGALPDLTNDTVVLDGIGDVADPQPSLDVRRQQHLVDLYVQIAKAAGADCVAVLHHPNTGAAPPGVPVVDTVAVPPPTTFSVGPGPVVLPDDNTVGFQPDSDQFRDSAAAAVALRPLADWIKASPTGRLQLTGTTARLGDKAGQVDLSRRRAERVRDTLVSLGADQNRVTADGVGSYFPGYQPDQGPNGTLLPGPAQQNRQVIVTPSTG